MVRWRVAEATSTRVKSRFLAYLYMPLLSRLTPPFTVPTRQDVEGQAHLLRVGLGAMDWQPTSAHRNWRSHILGCSLVSRSRSGPRFGG